mmetsp:Transcript_77269/g.185070  ORF Transcript_77269/g.185070 Transcript_77269/m.185070 type:complete len:228 (-) Transcript_77269:220-903(-)
MGQDDGLQLAPCGIAVVPCQHVHLPLVHAQLANVGLEKEDIRALHQRIQDLRGRQRALVSAHDLAAFLHPRQGGAAGNVQRLAPVLLRPAADLLRGPQELHLGHVHACGLPNLDEVLAHRADLLDVASHLVIHQREPVGHPEDELSACLGALVHAHGLVNSLGDVHPAGGLEAIVADKVWLLLDQLSQLCLCLTLLAHGADEVILPRRACVFVGPAGNVLRAHCHGP